MFLSRPLFYAAFAIWIVLAFFPMRVSCVVDDNANTHTNAELPPLPKPSPLIIDFSTSESAKESNDLLSQYISDFEILVSSLSEVVVRGDSPSANITLLTEFFWKLPSHDILLQQLHWTSTHPIPTEILRALDVQETQYIAPPCLYYTADLRHPSFETEEEKERAVQTLKNLAYSNSLHALSVEIGYGHKTKLVDLKLVYDVLRTCENLRVLELKMRHAGCVVGGWTPHAFPFRKIAAEHLHPSSSALTSPEESRREKLLDENKWQFPQLAVLKLDGYALQERSDGGYAWYWKGWEGYGDAWNAWAADEENNPEPERPVRMEDDGRSNLDVWLDIMEWSGLHTLELANPERESLEKLAGKGVLPGLKHLVLKGGDGDAVLAFLEGVGCDRGCLESLELRRVKFSNPPHDISTLIDIISRKHHHLKTLSLGSGSQYSDNPLFISAAQLADSTALLPLLEKLDIDIARPEFTGGYTWTWDWTLLDAVLKARGLRELTLRFPSPDSVHAGYGAVKFRESYGQMRIKYHQEGDETDEIDFVINKETLEALFGELRRRKRQGRDEDKEPKELAKLTVYVGDWDGRHEKELLPNMMLRVGFWECFVGEDGQERCEGKQTRVTE